MDGTPWVPPPHVWREIEMVQRRGGVEDEDDEYALLLQGQEEEEAEEEDEAEDDDDDRTRASRPWRPQRGRLHCRALDKWLDVCLWVYRSYRAWADQLYAAGLPVCARHARGRRGGRGRA